MKTQRAAERQQQRMQHQRACIFEPAAAQRAGERRGDTAAHAAIGHVHHQRDERDDQRDSGQRVDAELRDEPGFGDGDEDLHGHDRGRRAGEPQQAPPDRRGQKRMGQGESHAKRHARFPSCDGSGSMVWLSLVHHRSVPAFGRKDKALMLSRTASVPPLMSMSERDARVRKNMKKDGATEVACSQRRR